MTLSTLFGGGPSAREPPSMGDNLENYYGIDRGGHGWKGKSEMKKTKSTLSALTLLAFLFFLNLLLTCLKDTLQGNDPEIIVVPQQRVTRRVSGQLIGIVGPGVDPGVALSPVLSPIVNPSVGGDEKTATSNDDGATKRTRRSLLEDEDGEMSVETDAEDGVDNGPTRRAKKLPDYETSLETPETLRGGVVTTSEFEDYTVEGFPTLGPLDYTGVEPEYLGWETVDGVQTDAKGDRSSETYKAEEDHQLGSAESKVDGKTKATPKDLQDVDDGANTTVQADKHALQQPLTTVQADKQSLKHVAPTEPSNPVWEAVRAVLEGLGRRVAGKGWEESLESLQHPGMGFFYVGEKVVNYAMPILRDTSTKFGFDPARCKELVVCETSRLAWMWGDKDVTSAITGLFEWLYGMEEPELRSINREWKKKKKSCRNYIKRCKSEAGDDSWLPMIANVLEYFVT